MSEPEQVTIELPIPKACDPNKRLHYHQKAKMVKKERTEASLTVFLQDQFALPKNWEEATLTCRWYAPDNWQPDRDNATARLKAYIDGVVDAGVLENDNGLTIKPIQRETCKQAEARVVLMFEKTESEARR